MAKQFTNVGGLKPPKSAFDLTHEVKLTCGFGELIPILCETAIPGDIWKIGNEIVVRFQPMVTPALHDVKVKIDYFFCPLRLLWEHFEDWATGGPDGDDESIIPLARYTYDIKNTKYSLWDYFGFPVNVSPNGIQPVIFPWMAYEQIWFEYFRDENFQKITGMDSEGNEKETNNWIFYRNWINHTKDFQGQTNGNVIKKSWQKDYFTSAQPRQQRGTSPAIPLAGETNAQFNTQWAIGPTSGQTIQAIETANMIPFTMAGTQQANLFSELMNLRLNTNTVDLDNVQGADINDIRTGFQLQKYLERNQRAGARYTEWIKAHWGDHPRDDRLDRPEYLGGTRTPIIISEVLQTSQSDNTPQGNMAGHGITADKNFVTSYRVKEFGIIMGIMCIQPKLSYMSQGIHKQWLIRERFDLPLPEFVNLSEQPVLAGELYATTDTNNNTRVFGYQGIYDEHRVRYDRVAGDMRDTMDTWHMARKFSAPVYLNESFLKMNVQQRPFILPGDDAKNCIVNIANTIKAIRPLPFMAEPGLIDHH